MHCFKYLGTVALTVSALVAGTGAATINKEKGLEVAPRNKGTIEGRCVATDRGLYASYYAQAPLHTDDMDAACKKTKECVFNNTISAINERCGGDGAGGISFKVDLIINHGEELTKAFLCAWDANCVCPNY